MVFVKVFVTTVVLGVVFIWTPVGRVLGEFGMTVVWLAVVAFVANRHGEKHPDPTGADRVKWDRRYWS